MHGGDVPGDAGEIDPVFCDELERAAAIPGDGELQALLHGCVDHAEPVPRVPRDGHGGPPLAVHEEDVGVVARVCGCGGCVLEHPRGGRPGHGLQGVQVVAGNDEELLLH